MTQETSQWNSSLYDTHHSFVHEYGASLIDLLAPERGERILDVGCGTGHLTAKIADSGATVVGLDQSVEMLAQAREQYPDRTFIEGDARDIEFDRPFDAVFSNAALHWIPEADAVAASLAAALKPGGRMVVELGGTGNIETIETGLIEAAADAGYDIAPENPWYFPSVGEYATVLEDAGFEVRDATLFDRPTTLDNGEAGLENWLQMFAGAMLDVIPEADQQAVLNDVTARLRRELFENGEWVADYRRLRVRAVKL
ncbi:methyltransferase domain-containing protein [Haladaptatus sp. DJG-WS-42]|uniref:methyltransferase domain-containing protein n=1 Tax=Haladaptatus sp. DJG-WS-42 TaxID=3120516 RepID=UPI0030D45483